MRQMCFYSLFPFYVNSMLPEITWCGVCLFAAVKMIVLSVFSLTFEGGKPLSPSCRPTEGSLAPEQRGPLTKLRPLRHVASSHRGNLPLLHGGDNVQTDSWRERQKFSLFLFQRSPLCSGPLFLAYARAKCSASVSLYLSIMQTFQIPHHLASIYSVWCFD